MLKGKLIHPDIMAALVFCGHGDKILIADGNYPLKSKTRKTKTVYLGLKPGLPTVTDVLETIQSVVNIADGTTPEIFNTFTEMMNGIKLTELGRYEFYRACCISDVKLAISTGETRTYANLLVTIGVA